MNSVCRHWPCPFLSMCTSCVIRKNDTFPSWYSCSWSNCDWRTQLCFLCRGGVVFWGDSVGAEHIYSKLTEWSRLYGPFYKPSVALERASHGKYPLVSLPPEEVSNHALHRSCVRIKCFISGLDSLPMSKHEKLTNLGSLRQIPSTLSLIIISTWGIFRIKFSLHTHYQVPKLWLSWPANWGLCSVFAPSG